MSGKPSDAAPRYKLPALTATDVSAAGKEAYGTAADQRAADARKGLMAAALKAVGAGAGLALLGAGAGAAFKRGAHSDHHTVAEPAERAREAMERVPEIAADSAEGAGAGFGD